MGTEGTNPTADTETARAGEQNPALKRTARRPGQTLACGSCGSPVPVPARGRIPKWCSSSCRHRAWELGRAAASGRAAVEVLDRVIEVDKSVRVVEQVSVSPHGRAWPGALADLVTELDTGRVYDRDLPALADPLARVLAALDRRPGWRRQHVAALAEK